MRPHIVYNASMFPKAKSPVYETILLSVNSWYLSFSDFVLLTLLRENKPMTLRQSLLAYRLEICEQVKS